MTLEFDITNGNSAIEKTYNKQMCILFETKLKSLKIHKTHKIILKIIFCKISISLNSQVIMFSDRENLNIIQTRQIHGKFRNVTVEKCRCE